MIKVEQFGGLIPRASQKEGPDNAAVEAINVDLRGGSIKPFFAPLTKTGAISANTPSPNALLIPTQIPSAAFVATGNEVGAPIYYTPTSQPTYVVTVNDHLLYAVHIPTGQTPVAGQGCCDLHFTDTTLLSAFGYTDQNGLSAHAGDLTAYALGKWYVRNIPLAGAAVGKTIDQFRFNMPAGLDKLAYLGFAFVFDQVTGKNKVCFVDPDLQIEAFTKFTGGLGGLLANIYATIVDDDEIVTYLENVLPLIPQINGYPRQKNISVVRGRVSGVGTGGTTVARAVVSNANHDVLLLASVMKQLWQKTIFTSGLQTQIDTVTGATGWMAISKPTAAMALAVVGGTEQNITRSYVYTRVSEDGLEGGPSPPVTASGPRDGSWNLTSITAWDGTDQFQIGTPAGSMKHKRRIYRTPETSPTDAPVYRFVAEIADNVTSVNDTALDAALGEELSTTAYESAPEFRSAAMWINGMIGALRGTHVEFCEPFQYHAFPIANRVTLPFPGVDVGVHGDRFVVLTTFKPIVYSGTSPDSLIPTMVEEGEACRDAPFCTLSTSRGVMYPGISGWGLVSGSGYQNMTLAHMKPEDYEATVDATTFAFCDDERLYWAKRGATSGYALLFSAQEKALTKWDIGSPMYGASFYAPRRTRWAYYYTGGQMVLGKLFADTSQRLKWTWRSKLFTHARPVSFGCAIVVSTEWDSLSAAMKAREAALATVPPTLPYSISTSGLTQAEAWCFLKVWAFADNPTDKVLVYNDFVVNDDPVRLLSGYKSDSWQFEISGNIEVTQIAIAETERELNE